MITRFAPSPTGCLHLGHAYAAQFAYHLAKKNNGEFLLRFEDIDTTRVREKYYHFIQEDLHWLGIHWKEKPLRQIDRLPLYKRALEELKALEVVYPCFCTRREIQNEIASMSNAPHSTEGALYPETCKKISTSERKKRLDYGSAHCWRLNVQRAKELTGILFFQDTFHGEIQVDLSLLGDVILARKDIATSYHLAVVVDDAEQGITDVSRGEDLLPSAHVHCALQKLLGFPTPKFHHHRLILDNSGKRLAKRDNPLSLQTLREKGKSPKDLFR